MNIYSVFLTDVDAKMADISQAELGSERRSQIMVLPKFDTAVALIHKC